LDSADVIKWGLLHARHRTNVLRGVNVKAGQFRTAPKAYQRSCFVKQLMDERTLVSANSRRDASAKAERGMAASIAVSALNPQGR
jgi:hypothetical protein